MTGNAKEKKKQSDRKENEDEDDDRPSESAAVVSRNIISWTIYIVLIVVRVVCGPWLKGYVHPDEFFQGGQELWFGCSDINGRNSNLPWEFQPHHALRSVVPPTIMTWIPLSIYTSIKRQFVRLMFILRALISNSGGSSDDANDQQRQQSFAFWYSFRRVSNAVYESVSLSSLSGMEVLVIPRIACAILSVAVVDRAIWMLSSDQSHTTTESRRGDGSRGVPLSVLILASSWPTMVMLNRPFSNSMECFALTCLLLTILLRCRRRRVAAGSSNECNSSPLLPLPSVLAEFASIGILVAVGIFTRFTFVFFALPALLFCFFQRVLQLRFFVDNDEKEGMSQDRYWDSVFLKIGIAATNLLLVSCFIVYCDSQFYHKLARRLSLGGPISDENGVDSPFKTIQVTPWNAFSYNSKVSNLQDHGLHPRWTHSVVNMFILYGPATALVYMSILWRIAIYIKARASTMDSRARQADRILTVCQWTVVVGLGVLSIAPHQEPRFLLPLLVPISLIVGRIINSTHIPRSIMITGTVIWVIFNAILFTLFGILHQGGIVSSLLKVGDAQFPSANDTLGGGDKMVYFHTYMPPTFLTRTSGLDGKSTCPWDGAANSGTCSSSRLDMHSGCYGAPQIIDLKGAGWIELNELLREELACPNDTPTRTDVLGTQPKISKSIRVVMPPMSSLDESANEGDVTWSFTPTECVVPVPACSCRVVEQHQPHLTTEDLAPLPSLEYDSGGSPAILPFLLSVGDNLSLNVYEISVECNPE